MTFVAPTFIDEHELSFGTLNDTGGSGNSGAISVTAGDLLVIVGGSEDASRTLGTPTGGGLTYTLRQSVLVANYCAVYVWTAVCTATTSVTVSITVGGSSGIKAWGFNVLRFRNASVGASSKTNIASGAPSLGLTTTRENSAVVFINSDWAAQDGASRTYRTTGVGTFTEQTYYRDPDRYATYNGYYANVGVAAAKTVGLTAPGSQKYAIIAIEVQGTLNDLGTPATETDTAQTITVVQSSPPIAIDRATETDAANAFTITSPVTVAIGRATETDSAQSVTVIAPDVYDVGQATETDTAQSITPSATTTVAVGLATETDSAQAVTAVATSVITVGLATETDTAQVLTVAAGGLTIGVGQAGETDTAGGVTPSLVNVLPVGLATETDSAQAVAVAAANVIAVGLATETDSAQAVTPLTGVSTVAIGLATELDAAHDVVPAGSGTELVNTAEEFDSAQSITPLGTITLAIGQATEVDSANVIAPLAGVLTTAVGLATEVDSAQAVSVSAAGATPVDTAAEVDSAGPIIVNTTVSVPIGLASEVNSADVIAVASLIVVPIDVAEESSSALPITVVTPAQLVTIGVAVELDAALGVDPTPGPAMIAVGAAEEADEALVVSIVESNAIIPIGIAEEMNAALSITPRSVGMGTPFNSTGPCSPLDSWQPIWCEELSPAAMAVTGDAVQMAADILWVLSGQRFGLCQVTLRPCREECSNGYWSFSDWWPGVGNGVRSSAGGGPRPWWFNGLWYNICGGCTGQCSCTLLDVAYLPAPTREVIEVKLDGDVMNSSQYRVDENRKLVRIDGHLWPSCQDMAAADTQPNTWSVTLTVGEDVPLLARRAVGQLAAELARDCVGEDCQLPYEITSLSRQGVNMSFGSPSETDAAWAQLGLRWVSLFLQTYNPNQLMHRAKVYDVDRNPRPWRRVDTI
jgi:hypothetical protein